MSEHCDSSCDAEKQLLVDDPSVLCEYAKHMAALFGDQRTPSYHDLAHMYLALHEKLRAAEATSAGLREALDDLAPRFHSIAHESLDPDTDEYNPQAIALCNTPRCRRLRALLAPPTGEFSEQKP